MDEILKYRAAKMRRNLTRAEAGLWRILRNRKLSRYKFRRQYIIEPYIVDFVCLHKKCIIELDGESHKYQKAYDIRRTLYLNKQGFKVIRFTNTQLFSNYEKVIESIIQIMQEAK